MRALIVDDETPARERLKRLIAQYPEIEVVGEASDGLSALEQIDRLQPSIVFLDIEMPELSGLEVAELMTDRDLKIIFVTAYSEHAIKAFELSAVDYLLKPVAPARLQLSLEKIKRSTTTQKNLSELIDSLTDKSIPKQFAIRTGSKYIVLEPDKISAILATDHYATILSDSKKVLADDSLDSLAKRLNPEIFIWVHRSSIINIHYLKELEREGDRKYIAVLNDLHKTRVYVSRERLAELKLKLTL